MPPLLDGVYTVSILATDPLTNISLSSEPAHLTIATQIPPSPLIEVPAPQERLRTAQVFMRGVHRPIQQYHSISMEKILQRSEQMLKESGPSGHLL